MCLGFDQRKKSDVSKKSLKSSRTQFMHWYWDVKRMVGRKEKTY